MEASILSSKPGGQTSHFAKPRWCNNLGWRRHCTWLVGSEFKLQSQNSIWRFTMWAATASEWEKRGVLSESDLALVCSTLQTNTNPRPYSIFASCCPIAVPGTACTARRCRGKWGKDPAPWHLWPWRSDHPMVKRIMTSDSIRKKWNKKKATPRNRW